MKWRLMKEADEGAEGSAAEPVGQEDVGSSDDSSMWDDLLDDGADEATEVEAAEPMEQPTVEEVGGEAETKPEVVTEVVAPPPAEAVVAPIVEKPVEAVAPLPAEVVSQAPLPEAQQQFTPTPEEREFLRQQALTGLAQRYQLSEEDATALQVEPEKVLPKLAANLHAAIYEQVLQRVYAEAPALIERNLRAQEDTRRAEEAFYAKWGNLRQHEAEVQRVAVMWRQMYPQATLEQAIDGIGAAANALLGLGQAAPVAAAPPPPAPPPPPAGPSSRVGAVPPSRSRLSAEEQSFVDLSKVFEEEM